MASEDQYLPPYINNNDYKSNNIVYHNSKHPWLPPGFRFHPTDEELVSFYLAKKVENEAFSDLAIAQIDLNKFEPWDLPAMAKMGEREWYFYNLLDRKYPTGLRANRATDAGYWKATGKDREVMNSKTNILVGMKKTLVFYKGRAPKGEKSNWVMHEYRLAEGHHLRASKEERVVCRIFQKNIIASSSAPSLPPLMEPPIPPLYSSKVKYPQPESSIKSSASLMITAQTHDDSFNEFSAINLSPNTILKALLDDNIMKQKDIFISNCIKHHDLSNNYHSGHGLEQQNLETMCIPNNTSQPQEDNNHSVQLIPSNLMQHQNLYTNMVSTLSRCENLELDYLWKY